MRMLQHSVAFADDDFHQEWSLKRSDLRRSQQSTRSTQTCTSSKTIYSAACWPRLTNATVLQNAQAQSSSEAQNAWSSDFIIEFQAVLYMLLMTIISALGMTGVKHTAINPPLFAEDEEVRNAQEGKELQSPTKRL